jgi:hypothetical protein
MDTTSTSTARTKDDGVDSSCLDPFPRVHRAHEHPRDSIGAPAACAAML